MGKDSENSSVKLKFWGVRGSTPCANRENMVYGGNTTCLQVIIPGTDEVLIMDSGTGIRNLGNQLLKEKDAIKGRIFITHPHWDHIQGFPFFKPIYHPASQFDIHMPSQATGGCKEILSGHLTKTFFPVSIEMLDAKLEYLTQEPGRQNYGPYEIEYMLANHPINTAIYKIRVQDKVIVFCPDNELIPISEKTEAYFYTKLKEFFLHADLLIHDGQFDRKSYRKKVGWGHSAWEEVVEFAQKSQVKKLVLTHHDPDSDDSYLERLDEELQVNHSADFDLLQLAREGNVIEV